MSYLSIFNQQYDVAIYGSGYAGLAAAWALVAAGKKVLLFDRRMDVAWESGRSFAPHAGDYQNELWQDFLANLQSRNLYNNGIIDSAGAEVVIAAKLRGQRSQLQTLLNAWPVQAAMAGEQIQSVSVATKSGLRTITANCWIDASDEAALFRLAFPQSTEQGRAPSWFEYRAILFQETDIDIIPARLAESLFLEKRLWKNEFTLCARAAKPYRLPELLQVMQDAKVLLDEPLQEAPIVAFSVFPLPVYEAGSCSSFTHRGNLFAASPALSQYQIDTLGARFRLGIEAADLTQKSTFVIASENKIHHLPIRRESCDVFIAGAGTSGALAALAAQREDVKVLLSDTATFAGGVGSGGQINGYFHGQQGGLFEEFDNQAQQVGKVLNPAKPARSHETKKIAFESTFAGDFLAETMVFNVAVQDKKVVSLKLISPREIIEVTPKTVIDCTGDGDVAALAGADFDFGRKEDGFPLSYSQPCLHVKGSTVRGANFDAGWCDPTDPEDLTRARLTAISQYLRDEFSDEFHLILFAPILGLRQSRQIKTEEQLSLNDLISHTTRDFSIGLARSPLDTHSIDYEFEDDETLFWLWGCKSFRESTFADMPYGMLVPQGFANLWIACRAAGITPPAAYAARMQRDMQRIGEAAGYAAAMAAKDHTNAMHLSPETLQEKLRQSGALISSTEEEKENGDIISQFDSGVPGAYLWEIYQNRDRFEREIISRLNSANTDISWLAAVILAMWNDRRAEPRFIHAIKNTETGVDTPPMACGPFSQLIDVPNWFLAINLLRRCGSDACLPALRQVAERPNNILNLRTSIALTVSRLASQLDKSGKATAADILKVLLQDAVPDTFVRPSRSIYRSLKGEPQQPLPQEPQDVDTREEHRWRLDFAITKAARALGIENPVDITMWLNDERALVRKAFAHVITT
jgi:ribulose 1,5-bisphosphate synthetase/thiazole synthase